MCIDIKNFHPNTPMKRFECMKMPIALVPDEIIQQCNLLDKVHNGHIRVEICKGMHGLLQAGMIANELLQKRLAKHGCTPCHHTPGLWKHNTRNIVFTLIVDDFGVQHAHKKDADHLIATLKEHHAMAEDWKGESHCGIALKWDCQQ